MKLKLVNMSCQSDDSSRITMSLKAMYSWKGTDCSDVIKVSYNGKNRGLYLTVKAANAGVGLVLERIIDLVHEVDMEQVSPEDHLGSIFHTLADRLKLEYNKEVVSAVLDEHFKFMKGGGS